ncbi:vasoactive intestinal polypeptide receptor 2 isoform X1 [Dunckerocampus dactyliophorus]|uniref:vasoactive intestinal polypeptide receptor 2 isoform X1 n=1 Tax=Dunckerocampus dactyliophorus TaxID=161453 RepID=UPI002404EE47|nr:vasoactive intestinal polypeptide receptor 2 isoform X1 [Dunckerocampus dactyliophorus]
MLGKGSHSIFTPLGNNFASGQSSQMLLCRMAVSGDFCWKRVATLLCLLLLQQTTKAIHPDCALVVQHMKAQDECSQILKQEESNLSTGAVCPTAWDNIRCWWRAEVGQVVRVSCANVSQLFQKRGYVYRNCTEDGWSELYPTYKEACEFAEDSQSEAETTYFSNFKQVYTAGYATSFISLISAIFVFTVFRKFHCTRNYIHMNLFFSFILRASAVFIKDSVLFSDENLDHCFMSTTSCKSAVAFFQFSILANYFWLLVEGMYLQTLLALTFVFQKKYFWWYILIGWGLPTTIITAWILARNFYDNRGCWDDTDVAFIWWIIKAPITASLLVNFIIFINVIRILVQKLRCPGVGGNDTSHFKKHRSRGSYLHRAWFGVFSGICGVPALLLLKWRGASGAEEEVLEVADREVSALQETTSRFVHREQHRYSDIRPGQIQPQRPAQRCQRSHQQHLLRLTNTHGGPAHHGTYLTPDHTTTYMMVLVCGQCGISHLCTLCSSMCY